MSFNPKEHIILLKNKEYLETKWRLVWFRDEHPQGQVLTEIVSVEPILIMKAYIQDSEGRVLATGHGTAQAKQGAIWAGREIEKAETAAIGRALGNAGYGTQFTDEDEGDNLADSPVERKSQTGGESRENSDNSHETPSNRLDAATVRKIAEIADFKAMLPTFAHRKAIIELLDRNGVFDGADTMEVYWTRIAMYRDERAAGTPQEKTPEAAIEAVKKLLADFAGISA